MSSNTVIQRIKSGDQLAMKDLYLSLRNPFLQWMKQSYNCTEEDAKDVFQISMVIFYDNVMKGKLDKLESAINTYLFGIGKNKMMELQRSRQKKINLEKELKQLVSGGEEMNNNAHAYEVETVRKALNDMGDPCKSILEYYYYFQFSMKEIAEKLCYKSAKTVKNSKYQCMQRLQRLVATLMSKRA